MSSHIQAFNFIKYTKVNSIMKVSERKLLSCCQYSDIIDTCRQARSHNFIGPSQSTKNNTEKTAKMLNNMTQDIVFL